MPAYVIVLMEEISDPSALDEYRRLALPALAEREVAFRIRRGEFEVREGDDIQSVVMLEFPTMEAAKDWYDSPEYQEALKARRKGVKCHVIMAQGAEPAA